MIECFRHKIYWRGLLHDLSKFLPDEFFPYTNYFYGKKNENISKGRDETGYYKPTDTGDAKFDFAWLLHQKRNRHHFQWWILPEDDGGVKYLKMQYPYNVEMICDWIGAGKAQGHFSPKEDYLFETRRWYDANKTKLQLHRNTRAFVEGYLSYKGRYIKDV